MLSPMAERLRSELDLQRLAVREQLGDVDAARSGEAPEVALGDLDPAALVGGELAAGEPGRARDLAAREPLLAPDVPELAADVLGARPSLGRDRQSWPCPRIGSGPHLKRLPDRSAP